MLKSKEKGLTSPTIHVGRLVRGHIINVMEEQLSVIAVALNLTKQGFGSRLSRAYFGNVQDLIDVSVVCDYNFFSAIAALIDDAGVTPIDLKGKQIIDLQSKIRELEKSLAAAKDMESVLKDAVSIYKKHVSKTEG